MQVLHTLPVKDWQEIFSAEQQQAAVNSVEEGKIVYFPQLPFVLLPAERRFLSPLYVDPKVKNISYNPATDELRGARITPEEHAQLKTLLTRFAQQAHHLVLALFPMYESNLVVARTSFRPVEVHGRESSYRKDDSRLHIDAFPATPNQGQRILRVFTNINATDHDRVWRVGEPFETVAKHFLSKIRKPFPGSAALLQLLNITKTRRSAYDHYMLQIHNRMKADGHYQCHAQQTEIRFPPGSTWIVQTDQVSHAAMSGQYVLEQTFYLPVNGMVDAAKSPLRILERLTGKTLVSC